MSPNHRPRLARVLGQPDKFRLSLRGVRFDLSWPDVEQLAEEVTRVLDNVARDAFARHQAADPHCTCNDCIEALDQDLRKA
jgi:hypothetical protein